MKIINRFNRPVRIVEEAQDLRFITTTGDNETAYHPIEDLPTYFVVKVEIKIAWFWVTLYSESCDISDGDTRTYIINRAIDLCEKLEGRKDK